MIPTEPIVRAPAAVLLLTDDGMSALLELARGGPLRAEALAGAIADGWIVDGAPVGILADGLAALTAPVCQIDLQRGDRRGHGAADGRCGAVIVPSGEDGVKKLVVVATQFLPDVLCRLNDVAPRPRVSPAVVLRYRPHELGQILSSRDGALAGRLAGAEGAAAATQLVASLREHWRAELRWRAAGASPGRRVVEVLDTDRGMWLVVPADDALELWPTTPTTVYRGLVKLFPDRSEIDLGA